MRGVPGEMHQAGRPQQRRVDTGKRQGRHQDHRRVEGVERPGEELPTVRDQPREQLEHEERDDPVMHRLAAQLGCAQQLVPAAAKSAESLSHIRPSDLVPDGCEAPRARRIPGRDDVLAAVADEAAPAAGDGYVGAAGTVNVVLTGAAGAAGGA